MALLVGLAPAATITCGGRGSTAPGAGGEPAAQDFLPAATPRPAVGGGSAAGQPGGARPAARAPQPGEVAPDFALPAIGGGRFALKEQRGKPVVLMFTAGWCTTCIPEVRKLGQLAQEEAAAGLSILFLDVDPTESEREFLRLRQLGRGPERYWALDKDQKVTLAYRVLAADTKYVLDGAARVVYSSIGPTLYDTLKDQIARARAATGR